VISNDQLRTAFLTPAMKFYFDRKLAPLAGAIVDARIEELLKYLNISAYCHGGIPVNDEIDDVWHLWIMQTKEYAALCRKLVGGKFIHHSSNEYEAWSNPDIKTTPPDLVRGVGVLRSYVLNYGPFEAARVSYWPMAERLSAAIDGGLARLNAMLSQPLPGADAAVTEADALTLAA
jgi:hypothetical protein